MTEYRIIRRGGMFVVQRLYRRGTWWRAEQWNDKVCGFFPDIADAREFRDGVIETDRAALVYDMRQPYDVIE